MRIALLLLGLILVAMPAQCFWSTGHMIISKIAYDELERMDPTYLKQIQSEIDELTQYSMEKNHSFVESAVWADDNKGIAWSAFNEWHFVDTPVIEDGFTGETGVEPMNATFAMYSMRKTLSNKNKPKFDSDLALSFAWRYLIHLVGDIHQPLHASTLYSEKYPNSDRGGNSFKINYAPNKDAKNLHALWDACLDQYGSIWAPLTETEYNTISSFATNLTSTITRKDVDARLKITDDRKWAEESYEISKNFVYTEIEDGGVPTKEYIDSRRIIIDEQLVVAGYRLADLMVSLKHATSDSVVEDILSRTK